LYINPFGEENGVSVPLLEIYGGVFSIWEQASLARQNVGVPFITTLSLYKSGFFKTGPGTTGTWIFDLTMIVLPPDSIPLESPSDFIIVQEAAIQDGKDSMRRFLPPVTRKHVIDYENVSAFILSTPLKGDMSEEAYVRVQSNMKREDARRSYRSGLEQLERIGDFPPANQASMLDTRTKYLAS